MKKIALFPGSFDPIHIGHIDIVERAIPLFEKIYIGIGKNAQKKSLFPLEKRKKWLEDFFSENENIEIITYEGLTVNTCKKLGAKYIIRGLRNSGDFEFEKGIAQMNQSMFPDIETVFFLTRPEYAAVSSSILRDIYRNKGDISPFVPHTVSL